MHDLPTLNNKLDALQPKEIIKSIYMDFDNLTLSFSGAEDVVLIDMACKQGLKPNVFTLDTGRLHPQTYQFLQAVMEHYSINIQILTPESTALKRLTDKKGLFSFYQDGHQECCGLRKVEPLKNHLSNFSGWITGQRKDQSLTTRGALSIVEVDATFIGIESNLLKFNPLCNWTSEQVWLYIRSLEVPYNSLHDKGYTSIGCEPCTRAILPHQDPREGRWWWEESDKKECGLHSKKSSS
ncbi:MAG: phosphoadenosine phosphosulfate reductase [Cycloclasticus sp. symbiont of Poecilosclerida sp. M]|nr:MAG: phosphoadenosine phosphosulfate reductase [Cycloclasticus sp. symbiont of Poecilosclerida sp. M]